MHVESSIRHGDGVRGRPTRDLYRLIEHASDYIVALDADGRFSYVSPSVERDLGHPAATTLGRSAVEFVHADDAPALEAALEAARAGERSLPPMRLRVRTADGSHRLVETQGNNLLDDPSVSAIVLNGRDVTERHRAEEARAVAEHRFRALVETMPAVTYVWESTINKGPGDALVTYTSPQIESLLGFTADEWEAEPMLWAARLHPDDRAAVLERTAESERDGVPFEMEYRYLARDGRVVWVRDSAVLIDRTPDGRPWRFQGVMMDVTETREAQRRLAEAERRYRTLVERLPAITYLDRIESVDDRVRYRKVYVSPQVETILGYPVERWTAELLWERSLHPDDRTRVLEQTAACVADERPIDIEYRTVATDGRTVWVREQSTPLREGEDLYWQGVMYDVTDTKEAELALRQAEERFRTLVEQIPAVTFTDDTPAHEHLYISPQIRHLIGVDPEKAMADPELFRRHVHPDDERWVWDAWDEAADAGRPFEAEYRVVHEDGTLRWVWERSAFVGSGDRRVVQGVLFDVTERRHDEEVLRESEAEVRRSLELLRRTDEERRRLLRHLVTSEAADRGRLAEGIEDRSLQDFAAVGMRLETLRRNLEDPEQRGAVDRLGETVQQALARLRHLLVELRPRELDTEGLAAALERFARSSAPAGVTVDVRNALSAEPEPEIRALAYRIGQDAVSSAFDRGDGADVLVVVEERDDGHLVRVGGDGMAIRPPTADDEAVVSMRERVRAAGGWLRVAGDGSIELWFPRRLEDGP